jgi:hypothetical protein
MTSTTTVAISVGRAKAKTRPKIKTTTNPRAACTLIILSMALFKWTRPARSNTIVDQVVANHVCSLLAAHLVDFASLDQDTVKRGSMAKSISHRRCATYPLMVFPSSADGSIIWMGK